jgi:hypothetical protein
MAPSSQVTHRTSRARLSPSSSAGAQRAAGPGSGRCAWAPSSCQALRCQGVLGRPGQRWWSYEPLRSRPAGRQPGPAGLDAQDTGVRCTVARRALGEQVPAGTSRAGTGHARARQGLAAVASGVRRLTSRVPAGAHAGSMLAIRQVSIIRRRSHRGRPAQPAASAGVLADDARRPSAPQSAGGAPHPDRLIASRLAILVSKSARWRGEPSEPPGPDQAEQDRAHRIPG